MKRFRVMPRVARVQMHEEPSEENMAAANATRVALMPYVGMTHAALVEAMDLRPVVVQALRDLRQEG